MTAVIFSFFESYKVYSRTIKYIVLGKVYGNK